MAEIDRWFDEGVAQGATHMVVVCDSFDYEDYPVFVKPGQNVREVEQEYRNKSMQRVMEVYDLRADKPTQIAEHRSFNYGDEVALPATPAQPQQPSPERWRGGAWTPARGR